MTVLAEIEFRHAACGLCGADAPRPLAEVDRYAVPLCIVRCRECAHVYLDPRPADRDLPKLYDEDYYEGRGDYSYADDRAAPEVAAIRARARLDRIEELVPRGRLLEVGCSFGAFLRAAKERGFDVEGVDLSPYAVAHCRGRGLTVHEATLGTAPLPAAGFDVVYLSETIEHLAEPRLAAREAARVLAPGGVLVVGTANHDSLARVLRGRRWGYYMPGHLQYFSAASLCRLLAEEGLAVVRRRFGDDRSLSSLRRARRLASGRSRWRDVVKDVLVRISLCGWSLGAGMLVYARKP